MRRKRKEGPSHGGQALVEWAIFGAAGIVLWTACLHAARQLLDNTLARSTSVFAARKALSGETMAALPGVALIQGGDAFSGKATAEAGRSRARFAVELARARRGERSCCNLPSFGSLLSLFSE